MAYLKTKGIVIREVNTGEADKIITLFAKGKGKISSAARGARRPKSRFSSGTQLFCYSDFVLFKGKDLYSVNSCDVIEPFYEIRNDLIKLTYAAHLVDILEDVIQEEQPASKVLQLFLNCLYFLAKTDKSPDLIARIFEIRLLTILGYAPYVRGCLECGGEVTQQVSFSFIKCGFVCMNCMIKDPYAQAISIGAAKAIQHIVHSPMNDLFSFQLSPAVLNELSGIAKRYLKDHLEAEYTKLEFLNGLDIGSL